MRLLHAALSTLLLTGAALAVQDKAQTSKTDDAAEIAKQIPSYPLEKCLVSDEPLGEAVDILHEGRLVRFCCKSCVKQFKQDPAATLARIDEAIVAAQRASYPFDKCLVSGEALGSMGDPIELVHGTRLVRLCCKGCVKGFKKDPAAYMAKVDEALIAAQKKTYPLSTCLVSGMKIEGEGVDQLYGTTLTRFCCEKCAGAFAKEPQKYLPKLAEAKKSSPTEKKGI